MPAPVDAATQTFVLADLAGYSALTEAHGDLYAADTAAEFFAMARAMLPEFSATEVKTLGDAVLVRVPRAVDAIRLARRLLAEATEREQALGIRVAIHTGTAVRRGNDWFGSAVNVVARVADVAGAGQIVLTGAMRDAVSGDLATRALGRREFRNINDAVDLFVLDTESAADERVLDPVCRMLIHRERCRATAEFRGRTYRFCSDECLAIFRARPDRYASSS